MDISLKLAVLVMLVVTAVTAQHGHGHQEHGHQDYVDHHPKYQYAYAVHDGHTQDMKRHTEVRDGDKTEGEYSLMEADGTMRTVKYYVKGNSGFIATVHHSGTPTPAPVHKKFKGLEHY